MIWAQAPEVFHHGAPETSGDGLPVLMSHSDIADGTLVLWLGAATHFPNAAGLGPGRSLFAFDGSPWAIGCLHPKCGNLPFCRSCFPAFEAQPVKVQRPGGNGEAAAVASAATAGFGSASFITERDVACPSHTVP